MPTVPALQTIVSPGKALSAPVIANFTTLRDYVNSYVLFKDVASQTVSVAVTFSAIPVLSAGLSVTSGTSAVQALTATTGTFSGAIGATTGTFSGLVTAEAGATITGGNLTLTAGQAQPTRNDAGDTGTSLTIDWDEGNIQKVRMTGNCTFTFSNPLTGASYVLECLQDATGSRTATWPSTAKWDNGTAPTLTTGANKKDVFVFLWNGTNYIGGTFAQNVADTT